MQGPTKEAADAARSAAYMAVYAIEYAAMPINDRLAKCQLRALFRELRRFQH